MAVTDIHGVDQLERHALIFAAATEVASRAVLVADLEGTLAKLLKRLREDGLFAGEEDVLLWSRDGQSVDFEEANFTEREILNAIQSTARKAVIGTVFFSELASGSFTHAFIHSLPIAAALFVLAAALALALPRTPVSEEAAAE